MADPIVTTVGDEQIAQGIHGDSVGIPEFGQPRSTVVSTEGSGAGARDSRKFHRREVQRSDAMVAGIGDEDLATGADSDSSGVAKRTLGTDDRVDEASRTVYNANQADRVGLRDEHISKRIDRNTARISQLCVRCESSIAGIAACPVAGKRRNQPGGEIDFADDIIARIGDKQISCTVDSNSPRRIERCGGGYSVVARVPDISVASDGANHACRAVDLADSVVFCVRYKNISIVVDRNSPWPIQRGF